MDNPKSLLRIYLAEDHVLVGEALANLLLTLNEVGKVTHFKNGKELLDACAKEVPDLVFLDLEMPVLNGLQTLPLLQQYPNLQTLILTMNDERPIIELAMKNGAKGFLNKNCQLAEIKQAITSVLAGEIYLSQSIKNSLFGLNQSSSENKFQLSEELTERESEVLALICDGLSSKEIGEKLFLSPRTVESHKTTLMKKFDVHNTGKLISLAIKNKLVNP
jgi:DNA-binding NarL/FixJ family response regulator